jgi:hypothetical protein
MKRPSFGPLASIAAGLVAVQAVLLFGLRVGETRTLFDAASVAPSLELYGDRALVQTFVAQADGLTAITLYPLRRKGPVAGSVQLALEADPQTPVARATVPAAEFLARPEWTWTFPAVETSARRLFRLQVRVPDVSEGGGLSLAIGPPIYVDGVLAIGGRAQWGALRFQTRSRYSRVIDLLRRRPSVQRGAWVGFAAGAAMVLLATSLAALTLGLIQDRAVE